MNFKIGDTVTWTSQAGGRFKTKTGRIVEIIPVQGRPPKNLAQGALPRGHESYVVDTQNVPGCAPRLYWPRVNLLKLAKAAPAADTITPALAATEVK